MKATTMNGKYRVISCNAGTLDGLGYDYITIVKPVICPVCDKVWLKTFIYTSELEDTDMYSYDTEQCYIEQHCPNCRGAAIQNTYFFADKIYELSVPVTYTLHVETAGGAIDFGFLSVEKAKATADLLWDNSTTDHITITNDATDDVLYEVTAALPF